MPNKLAPTTQKAAFDALLAGNSVRLVFVDTASYTYSASHDFLADIPSGMRIATSGDLAGVTTSVVNTDDMRLDADDFSVTFAAAQPPCEGAWYYIWTGDEATSRLLKWVDTAPWLPLTPAPGGGVVNVTVDPLGIFQIQN